MRIMGITSNSYASDKMGKSVCDWAIACLCGGGGAGAVTDQ